MYTRDIGADVPSRNWIRGFERAAANNQPGAPGIRSKVGRGGLQ